MKRILPCFLPLIFPLIFIFIVFRPWWQQGLIPIAADTIVGLYHPWRDALAQNYPNGVPFKNYLVTDPVRQQYPWRYLAIESLKQGQLPLWNPYSLGGAPLMGNFQSAPFYPLNILFWIFSFPTAWSGQVLLTLILGALWMYLFLRHLRLTPLAAGFGSLCWTGSGFITAWLTQNTLAQTVIWLPLILLSLSNLLTKGLRRSWAWVVILSLALICSFLAGALQIFFYVLLATAIFAVWHLRGNSHSFWKLFASGILVFLIASPLLLAIVLGVDNSLRSVSQNAWQNPGWFIPWQNLVQFFAPDYFGNPATLNYFGVWNYMEFVGYIGVAGLFFALFAISRAVKNTGYYVFLLVISLVLSTPNIFSQIPYSLHFPLLSLAQPTRLISLTDFALVVLAAYGVNSLRETNKPVGKWGLIGVLIVLSLILGLSALIAFKFHLAVALRNLVVPAILLGSLSVFLAGYLLLPKKLWLWLIVLLTVFDLYRFASKFEPFSSPNQLFPETRITAYLDKRRDNEIFRVASLDDRIFPPNFNDYYHYQFISGYDSLFPRRYSELAAAIENNDPTKIDPGIFNRILTPKNYQNPLFLTLGVKYYLSFFPPDPTRFRPLVKEGQTTLYEDTKALPRAYFVPEVVPALNKPSALKAMFSPTYIPGQTAVVENFVSGSGNYYSVGKVLLEKYSASEIKIQTDNPGSGFLVLSDNYSPLWHAILDGKEVPIYPTNYAFRGVVVPEGSHRLSFVAKLF